MGLLTSPPSSFSTPVTELSKQPSENARPECCCGSTSESAPSYPRLTYFTKQQIFDANANRNLWMKQTFTTSSSFFFLQPLRQLLSALFQQDLLFPRVHWRLVLPCSRIFVVPGVPCLPSPLHVLQPEEGQDFIFLSTLGVDTTLASALQLPFQILHRTPGRARSATCLFVLALVPVERATRGHLARVPSADFLLQTTLVSCAASPSSSVTFPMFRLLTCYDRNCVSIEGKKCCHTPCWIGTRWPQSSSSDQPSAVSS